MSPTERIRRLVRHPLSVLAASTLSITLGALPIFLVGALAVFIRPEMGFGEARLGALATVYYLCSAVFTVVGGRVSERLGGPGAMSVAALLSLTGLLGIALVAETWTELAVLLAVCGMANGLAFPASNLAIARGVPLRRQGVAFGVKQSAGPYAVLLAGVSVPLIGTTIGWRWAFGIAAVATIPIVAGFRVRQVVPARARSDRTAVERGPLWVLSAAAFLAVSGTASLGAFYVESAVGSGVSPSVAGTMLALGSVVGVTNRIGWGWIADRRRDAHFLIVAALLAAGAAAFALLGFVGGALSLFAITVFVFSTGWAWPSVLSFAVVHRSPQAPGAASGILGAGQFGGGILGPLIFGIIVEATSYRAAWAAAAAMILSAGACALVGGRWLERRVAETEGATA